MERFLPSTLLVAAVALAALGCSEPRSHATSVEPKGAGIPLTQQEVTVTFDRAMKSATITSATFQITGSKSGRHSGSITFPSGDMARFRTSTSFVAGETVTVALTDDIKSTSNKRLRSIAHQFEMARDPEPPPPPPVVPFELESANPPFESLDGTRSGSITLQLSKPFNPFSITATTVRLAGDRSGARTITFENRFGGTSLFGVRGDRPFLAGERITVSLSQQIGSTDSASLAAALFSLVVANAGSEWQDVPFVSATETVESIPILVDLDGDGRDELMNVARDGLCTVVEIEAGVADTVGTVQLAAGVADVATGDFDGNGAPEVICLADSEDRIYRFEGDPDSSTLIVSLSTLTLGGGRARALRAGQVDEDGICDLILVLADPLDGASVLWGSATQPLADSTDYTGFAAIAAPAVGDFDGDRMPDLAYPSSSGDLIVEWGAGERSFTRGPALAPSAAAIAVAVANLDGDLRADLVAFPAAGSSGTAFRVEGGRGFVAADLAGGATNPGSTIVDWNGDGALDLLAPQASEATLALHLGDGRGAFQEEAEYALPADAIRLAAGDCDGDGIIDLALALSGGGWELRLGTTPVPPPANEFHVPDLAATEGASGVPFEVVADHETEMDGYTVALTFDAGVLEMTSLSTTGTAAEAIGIDFETPLIDNGNGTAVLAVIFDFLPPFLGQTLPAAPDHTIAAGALDVAAGTGGTTTTLALENDVGSPPTDNVIVDAGTSVRPNLVSGTVTIQDAGSEPLFVRGNANASGGVDLADSLFLDAYLFSNGPAPPCMDAADANDDGHVNLADSQYLLNFIFSEGPEPTSPYPAAGTDPTSDSLDCLGS